MMLVLSIEETKELKKALIIEISRLEYRLSQIRGTDQARENAILERMSTLNGILDRM